MDEMATSRPDLLSSLGFTLKDMQGKAYRVSSSDGAR